VRAAASVSVSVSAPASVSVSAHMQLQPCKHSLVSVSVIDFIGHVNFD